MLTFQSPSHDRSDLKRDRDREYERDYERDIREYEREREVKESRGSKESRKRTSLVSHCLYQESSRPILSGDINAVAKSH